MSDDPVPGPAARTEARSGAARALAAAAVLTGSATYLLGRIDFARRHHLGGDASRYWPAALAQIWLPGLALTVALAVAALVARRRNRRR